MAKNLFEKWDEADNDEKRRLLAEALISREYGALVIGMLGPDGLHYQMTDVTEGVPPIVLRGVAEELVTNVRSRQRVR